MTTQKRELRRWLVGSLAMGLSIALCSCSTNTTPLKQDLANAEMEINNARDRNARQYAPLELRIAEEKLSQARDAFEDEDYSQASYLADEALVSAKLADAKARTERNKEMVQELNDSISVLKQEIVRSQGQSQ
ncbi:MAG TPA: DUF4398 domain-containing protein [Thermodesulfobacteriota bacterium]|nr:DUF4398 domain-containing protein [Thermodesulfobacteriota bacterium]